MITDSTPAERRRFHRFNIEGHVRLYTDFVEWQSKLIDISLKGVLIERPAGWMGRTGENYQIEVKIESLTNIAMHVITAHIMPHYIGFHCEKIDLDSFTQLKRLVELNLGDPEMLNRELLALG